MDVWKVWMDEWYAWLHGLEGWNGWMDGGMDGWNASNCQSSSGQQGAEEHRTCPPVLFPDFTHTPVMLWPQHNVPPNRAPSQREQLSARAVVTCTTRAHCAFDLSHVACGLGFPPAADVPVLKLAVRVPSLSFTGVGEMSISPSAARSFLR